MPNLEELQKRWLSVSGMISDAESNMHPRALLPAMQGLASVLGGLIVYLSDDAPEIKNIEHVITLQVPDAFLAGRKPPLGVMPNWRWLEIRAEALIDAIERNLLSPVKSELVDGWLNELFAVWSQIIDHRRNTKAEPVNEASVASAKEPTRPTDESIRQAFQNIWTRHAGAPGYQRQEWDELRQLLFRRFGIEL